MGGNIAGKIAGNWFHRGLQLLFMGCVTGFLAGVVVTFYNICVSLAEGFSTDLYAYVREHWFLVPVLLAALAAVALLIGVLVQLVPMVRGSGIPQTEGAARGILKYNPFVTLCSMFAASLLCVFAGMSAGGEGPSIQIGGMCGYGPSRLFSRTDMLRRYQITGGGCAGLAVAFNAPLTGMAFAFEETHKKFSPEVFICAFSSVVTGVVTRNLIRGGLGLGTGAAFSSFAFAEIAYPYAAYGYILLAAFVCALCGVIFFHTVKGLKKVMEEKVTFLSGAGRMLIPFLLAGVFGLVTVYAMGGGHALIEALGTQGGATEMSLQESFSLGLAGTLALALLFKFAASVVNMSCGVPCGVFIPMLAIGAAAGALLSLFMQEFLGMDASYSDLIVMVSLASFFTCVVRAPITGVVMVVELTWSFTPLLPVVLGVAVGYMVGQAAGTEPIYEYMLGRIVEERGVRPEHFYRSFLVRAHSIVSDMTVKDVLWPAGAAVKALSRGEESIVPGADTVLRAGDVITVDAETPDPAATERELCLLTGNPPPRKVPKNGKKRKPAAR